MRKIILNHFWGPWHVAPAVTMLCFECLKMPRSKNVLILHNYSLRSKLFYRPLPQCLAAPKGVPPVCRGHLEPPLGTALAPHRLETTGVQSPYSDTGQANSLESPLDMSLLMALLFTHD